MVALKRLPFLQRLLACRRLRSSSRPALASAHASMRSHGESHPKVQRLVLSIKDVAAQRASFNNPNPPALSYNSTDARTGRASGKFVLGSRLRGGGVAMMPNKTLPKSPPKTKSTFLSRESKCQGIE
eukprot:3098591-Amphidinium_carterae.1